MIKQLYFPQITIPHRLRAIKNCIALGLLMSVIVSWRLWTSDREFPLIPLFESMPLIPHPLDKVLFGALILLPVLTLLLRKPRITIALTLVIGVFMAISDQNRLQPWFYQYMLMLLVLSFYNWRVDEPKDYTVIFSALKVIIAAIYFWSGVQKLNPNFMADTWPWIIKPLEKVLTAEECNVILNCGYGVPFIELFIGIGLLFGSAKRVAIPLAISMHLFILLLLGPLGHNYNPVIWGWNITMIFIVYFLFAGRAESKYYHISYLFSFKPIYIVLFLCGFMPALNLFNKWDSYLSASLYSGNTSSGTIHLSSNAKSKLSYYIQYLTEEDGEDYTLNIKRWAMAELGVPGYPEKRIFEAVERHIQKITCCDDEVNLSYKEKWSILANR